MTLPEIPLDDSILDLLESALGIDEGAECSSLWAFLDMLSRLGGSDPTAIAGEEGGILVMRDPHYSDHDLIRALVAEIRKLRAAT